MTEKNTSVDTTHKSLSVIVTVVCLHCKHTTNERRDIFFERTSVWIVCSRCGSMHEVVITTSIALSATATPLTLSYFQLLERGIGLDVVYCVR